MTLSTIRTLGLTLAIFGCSAAAGDWPNYRGPEYNGRSQETLGQWPSQGPKELWRVQTPNGFSSYTVSQGRAFTIVGRVIEEVMREVVVAVDAQTGKELWSELLGVANYGHQGGNDGTSKNRGGDGPRSTPTIDGDKVYVLSADLLLVSLEASSGKRVWTKDILREHKGKNITWKNAASPVIEGDLIFVAGGGEGEALLGIDKNSGKTVWKTQSDVMTHATPVLATIHGVRQVIFFTKEGLVSLKPATGEILWRQSFPFNVSTAASPVIAENIVYCSAGYGVGAGAYEISKQGDKFSSKELWRTTGNSLANHWSTPVHKEGYLYGMFQFKEYGDGPLKCVELKTGKTMWSQKGFGPGNVTLVGSHLLALSDAGELVQIDPNPKSYKELSRFQAVTGKCWSTPTVANGRIYVRSTVEGACFESGSKLTVR
jgi:outer membrane protein assembly factor BamB